MSEILGTKFIKKRKSKLAPTEEHRYKEREIKKFYNLNLEKHGNRKPYQMDERKEHEQRFENIKGLIEVSYFEIILSKILNSTKS